MRLNVKADQVRAEQPLQQAALPGADAGGLGVRARDMPENGQARGGALFLDDRWKQREVVVLQQYDGAALRRDLFQQGHREFAVDVAVVPPVFGAEQRPRVGDVAERPDTFIGEPVVEAALLLGRQPDAPPRVLWRIGQNEYVC